MLRENEDPRNHDPYSGIDMVAAKVRCDIRNWARAVELGIDDKLPNIRKLSGAMWAANDAIKRFEEEQESVRVDQDLSPEGKAKALAKLARELLPDLEAKLQQLTAEVTTNEVEVPGTIMSEVLGKHFAPPTEPADIAMAQEIRAYLRSLPEGNRTHEVMKLLSNGDTAIAGAVLHAPAYLTGVDLGFVKQLQEQLARAAAPERFDQFDAYLEASLASRRALDGAIRVIGSMTNVLTEIRKPPTMEESLSPEQQRDLKQHRIRMNLSERLAETFTKLAEEPSEQREAA